MDSDYEYEYDSESYNSDGDSYAPEQDDTSDAILFERTRLDSPYDAPTMPDVHCGVTMFPAGNLLPEMRRCLRDITEILGIPEAATAVLLRKHNWFKDALLEAFYSDPETLLRKCGVDNRCNPKEALKPADNVCLICFDSMGESKFAMPCGHEFCLGCWRGYCANAVQEGTTCICATCPQVGCNEVITEIEVQAVASEFVKKFQDFQLRNFVESNALTRWCPGKGCDRVACAQSAFQMEKCQNIAHCGDCQISFCMICGKEPHSPCSCKDLRKWNEKCQDESESANWILVNTKSCPSCVTRIEKNQGCNHMTCRKCQHEFCWLCMADWDKHGYNYDCNRYNPDNNKNQAEDKPDTLARVKRELDRYLHYYKRYQSHTDGQKFAQIQLEEAKERLVRLQSSHDSKWTDVDILKTANEKLVECRRVLKYTYAYGYFMESPIFSQMQKERFEHHQEMLEKFTENLSNLAEKWFENLKEEADKDGQSGDMERIDIVNQTRVVGAFMENILQCVEDGMDG